MPTKLADGLGLRDVLLWERKEEKKKTEEKTRVILSFFILSFFILSSFVRLAPNLVPPLQNYPDITKCLRQFVD
jgi:hypothetical protein